MVKNLRFHLRYVLIPVGLCTVGLATPWQFVTSKLLNQFGTTFVIEPSVVRSLFADVALVAAEPAPGHPHGTAAANRSMGSFFIERFGREMGKDVCFYQCSNSDYRNGRDGSRTWFWAKDAQVRPRSFNPTGVIGMVDVDQYVDMNEFMTEHFRPIVLYTFQPSDVSADRGEYIYTFTQDNQVVYRVGGGAEYKHPVWNYDADVITTTRLWAGRSWFKLANWIPLVTTAWLVDKKQTDEDHQLVLLTPIRRWFFLGALLARLLKGRPLSRLRVASGEFLRMLSQTSSGTYISTGRVNSLLSGRLTAREDATIASLARTTKSGLTLMHVKRLMPDDHNGATIVYEYHSQKLPEMCTTVYTGAAGLYVRGYQFRPMEYDSEAKQSLVSYMAPIIDGGLCPDLSLGNAKQAIEGRINQVKTNTSMTKFMLRTIDEFVELLGKSVGVKSKTLSPVDPETVYARQNRPTQRRILELAEFVETEPKGSNFIKREAYGKYSDPRIITAIEGNSKYRYSQYVYAFGDSLLKDQSWYAFGKTPLAIAEGVVQVCLHAKHVTNTDFSRFDGTISEVPRALERAIMLHYFKESTHPDLLQLMRDQCNMTCYLSAGGDTIQYNSGLARCSGSPETSAFNTLINAFCAYLAWRMTREAGSFVEPADAYKRLGIYGGDDGLSADLDPVIYRRAATKLGLKLEVEPINNGTHGVKFLNRIYGPEVWFGDLTSMCDIKRALSKFHLCVAMPKNVTNETKLAEKAFAYYLTDRYTPVLGMFVTAVVNSLPPQFQFRNIHTIWNAQFIEQVQYPNSVISANGTEVRPDWMMELFPEDVRLDILTEWLLNAPPNDLSYFLSPPSNIVERPVIVSSVDVVEDGDLAPRSEPAKKSPGKTRKRVRKSPRRRSRKPE